ncbi:MAG: addiction module protein [Ramlibacter sp.]
MHYDEPIAEVEAAWEEEIRRRVEAFERGEVETFSADDVFAEARRIAPVKQARFTALTRAELLAEISCCENRRIGLGASERGAGIDFVSGSRKEP